MEFIHRKASESEIVYMKRFEYWESDVVEFDWKYENAETFVMLEGEAVVEYAGGSISFGAGDLLVFPAGLECKWKVLEPVKKYYR